LRQARTRHGEEVERLAASDESPPHPLRIAREVRRFIERDTVLAFDGGDFSGWMRYYFKALRPGGWQINTVLGQLGTGLPFALGAKLGAGAARVVLLTGDGALGFCAAEFETAVRCRIPVVVVVGNDAAWGIEVFFQDKRGGPGGRVGTDLGRVRWDQVASAMGAHGEHVERPSDLGPALERAFACGGPACVDVTMGSIPSPQALAYARVFARRRAKLRHAAGVSGK
jgi:acetolactate synthase-1/2/3 large subunit